MPKNDKQEQYYDYLNLHGYDFPFKAKFKQRANRTYTSMDFEDGEHITFAGATEFPTTNAQGYALYLSPTKGVRVTSIEDLEVI